MSPRFLRSTLALAAIACALPLASLAQTPAKVDFPAASPAATIKQRVGVTDVEIAYSRPSAKGRKIFGGLVPFGQVWRTGANAATKVSFSTPIMLEGKEIPAGTYGLYTIPGEKEWTVIIHKDSAQWGAYEYKAENDVIRVAVKPESLPRAVETFTIGFDELRDTSATLALEWETTRVPIKLTLNLVPTLQPQIEAFMASSAEKKPYAQAAMFYFENKLDLNKAAQWMEAAIAENPKAFYLVYRKGLILKAKGDLAGAKAAAEASLAAAKAAGGSIGAEYTALNEALLASLK